MTGATPDSPRPNWLLTALPGLGTLRGYERAWLRSDLVAGLTVAAVTVPVALAYASLAGLPPVTGLYASLLPLVLYALLGTSRPLVVGVDSATAALVGATLAPLAAGQPEHLVALSATLALFVGVLCFAARPRPPGVPGRLPRQTYPRRLPHRRRAPP